MSDPTSESSPAPETPVPAQASVAPRLDPVRVHAALGNEMRFQMIRLLAGGDAISPRDFAKRFSADYENVSKHCRVLFNAGVIGLRAGGDARYRWYEIPPAYRVAPGVLDLGVCVLKL